jgi:hypothetical protein
MQTLEDVLRLAIQGEDPVVVDALLRKRGDYRPHAQFGVNLAVRACAQALEDAMPCVVCTSHPLGHLRTPPQKLS